MKILFVDDDEFMRKIYSDRFASEGYDVTMANSGASAEDCLSKNSFDLIILDNVMSDMRGIEVVKWLKEKDITTPVIVFSALSQDSDINEMKAAGVKEYVVKDRTTVSDLIGIIKKYNHN